MDPYWAALAEDGKCPFVLGDKQRIHIPHQHIILGDIINFVYGM